MNRVSSLYNTVFIHLPRHPIYGLALCAISTAYTVTHNTTAGWLTCALCIGFTLRFLLNTYAERIACITLIAALCAQGIRIQKVYDTCWSELDNSSWIIEGYIQDIQLGDAYRIVIQPIYMVQASSRARRSGKQPGIRISLPLILTSATKPDCAIGSSIVSGPVYLTKPSDPQLTTYALRQGILATAKTKRLRCLSQPAPLTLFSRLSCALARTRMDLYTLLDTRLKPHLSAHAYELFNALILGKSSSNARITWDRVGFNTWGIFHILARSGLHVTLLLMLLTLILSYIPLPLRFKDLFLIACIFIYTLFTWSSLSFIRAVIMACLYRYATARARRPHMWYLLHLTLLLVLLYNPFIITGLDAQLSFGFAYALLWLSQINSQERIARTQPLHTSPR